jgi:LytS/YehU family sensor histidine kinase
VTAHTVANDLRFILRIIVADTGLGINEDCGDGVGLTNIQKRLQILYGGNASLSLEPNSPRGLRAVIEVPYEKN